MEDKKIKGLENFRKFQDLIFEDIQQKIFSKFNKIKKENESSDLKITDNDFDIIWSEYILYFLYF